MLRHRKVLLGFTLVLVLGSLGGTIAYGLYLGSDEYRREVAADLSRRLGLEVELGAVVPRSISSRRFDGLTVRLPQSGTVVARLKHAIWRSTAGTSDNAYTLELHDGALMVGAGHWRPADYQRLLRSGLGHDFAALHITEIELQNIDFHWRGAGLAMTISGADGLITFDEEGRGHVALTAPRLNGVPVAEPVHVLATFVPGRGLSIERAEMRVGAVPLATLKLESLLGGAARSGTFTGRMVYQEHAAERWRVEVGGALHGTRLGELTGRMPGGAWHGRVDVEIEQAVFGPGPAGRARLEELRFTGVLEGLRLADFARLLREPDLQGQLRLAVHQGVLQRRDVKYLRLSGEAVEVPLQALTRLLNWGVVTGRLRVQINALAVVDNRLQFADVDVEAIPPRDGPAYMDRAALAALGRQVLGMDLSPALPERVEYVRMGARLLLDREGLRIRGTHGPDGRTLLTVKLWGREVALLRQPDQVYPLGDLVAWVRRRLRGREAGRIEEWWSGERQRRPASEPASKEEGAAAGGDM